jgi:hypothetical protein
VNSATHAWVEALLPELGWVGFDPTNWLVAGDRHIRTAIGRDYADVPPTHGIFRGRANSELTVAVRVTPSEGAPLAGPGAAGAGGLVDPGGEGAGAAGGASAADTAAADGAAAVVRVPTVSSQDRESPRLDRIKEPTQTTKKRILNGKKLDHHQSSQTIPKRQGSHNCGSIKKSISANGTTCLPSRHSSPDPRH